MHSAIGKKTLWSEGGAKVQHLYWHLKYWGPSGRPCSTYHVHYLCTYPFWSTSFLCMVTSWLGLISSWIDRHVVFGWSGEPSLWRCHYDVWKIIGICVKLITCIKVKVDGPYPKAEGSRMYCGWPWLLFNTSPLGGLGAFATSGVNFGQGKN